VLGEVIDNDRDLAAKVEECGVVLKRTILALKEMHDVGQARDGRYYLRFVKRQLA
jgi:hypothetical protein